MHIYYIRTSILPTISTTAYNIYKQVATFAGRTKYLGIQDMHKMQGCLNLPL